MSGCVVCIRRRMRYIGSGWQQRISPSGVPNGHRGQSGGTPDPPLGRNQTPVGQTSRMVLGDLRGDTAIVAQVFYGDSRGRSEFTRSPSRVFDLGGHPPRTCLAGRGNGGCPLFRQGKGDSPLFAKARKGYSPLCRPPPNPYPPRNSCYSPGAPSRMRRTVPASTSRPNGLVSKLMPSSNMPRCTTVSFV